MHRNHCCLPGATLVYYIPANKIATLFTEISLDCPAPGSAPCARPQAVRIAPSRTAQLLFDSADRRPMPFFRAVRFYGNMNKRTNISRRRRETRSHENTKLTGINILLSGWNGRAHTHTNTNTHTHLHLQWRSTEGQERSKCTIPPLSLLIAVEVSMTAT